MSGLSANDDDGNGKAKGGTDQVTSGLAGLTLGGDKAGDSSAVSQSSGGAVSWGHTTAAGGVSYRNPDGKEKKQRDMKPLESV